MNASLYKLVAAATLLSSVAFADQKPGGKSSAGQQCTPSQQADMGLPDMCMGGFNAPAAITVKNGWDFFADASFIYWHTSQELMEVGKTALFSPNANAVANPATSATFASADFSYKPGFQVGIGFDTGYDGWSVLGDYTWLHQTTTSSYGTAGGAVGGQTIWIPNDWFAGLAQVAQFRASAMTTSWKMNLDMANLVLSRPFYQGRQITITPRAGLRGLWIRQSYTVTASNANNGVLVTPASSSNRSQSWAVGPTASAEARWLVGCGFRFEGDLGFSTLYTRYTSLSHSEFDQPVATGQTPIDGTLATYNTLRFLAETGLGLGWGTYLDNQGYHIDFSARYDFMYMPSQNMMRATASGLAYSQVGRPAVSGDMYIHGLTINARFDF